MAFTRTPATGSPATYTGTADVDTLVLLDQPSDITISGLAANDVITVGAAALAVDSLTNFQVYGNDGTDLITVTAALLSNSLVQGGNGKDQIDLGASNLINSIARGGADDDIIRVFNLNQSTAQGSMGNDTINVNGNVFSSRVYGGADDDIININDTVVARNSRFNGSKGADEIIVNPLANLLQSSVFGGEGSDRILVNNNSSASFYSGDLGNDTLLISQTTPIDTPITTTVLGGDGNDAIALGAATTRVTYDVAGGKGADQLNLGGGVDVITFNRGDSVASTAQAFTNNNPALLDNTDTITFANGVDTITNFAGGGGSIADKINVDISTPATLVPLNGTLLNTPLSATNIYEVRGNYVGNVFTVSNVGLGALYIVGGGGLTVDQALRSSTNIFVSTNSILGSVDFT